MQPVIFSRERSYFHHARGGRRTLWTRDSRKGGNPTVGLHGAMDHSAIAAVNCDPTHLELSPCRRRRGLAIRSDRYRHSLPRTTSSSGRQRASPPTL